MNRRTLAIAVALAATFAAPAFSALKTGAKAPAFTAPAYLAGKAFTFKLSDALKKGPVVLYFFPAAYTPGCNIEAHLFSQAIDDFRKAGASVIGITAGNTDQLAKFSADNERCGGKFPVAADDGARIAAKYDATLAMKPSWSSRVSYVIAPDGTIRFVHDEMKPDAHIKQTLAAVQAMRKTPAK